MVKQESTRKVGIAIQPEEELLRGRFEMMHQQLNNPKQFKVRIFYSCTLIKSEFILSTKIRLTLRFITIYK